MAFPPIIVSSTNCWWEKTRGPKDSLIIDRELEILLAKIILPRQSTNIMKRIGEIRSPCLRPLEGLKKVEGDLLTSIAKEVVVTNWPISLITLELNPKAMNCFKRKAQCTWS